MIAVYWKGSRRSPDWWSYHVYHFPSCNILVFSLPLLQSQYHPCHQKHSYYMHCTATRIITSLYPAAQSCCCCCCHISWNVLHQPVGCCTSVGRSTPEEILMNAIPKPWFPLWCRGAESPMLNMIIIHGDVKPLSTLYHVSGVLCWNMVSKGRQCFGNNVNFEVCFGGI